MTAPIVARGTLCAALVLSGCGDQEGSGAWLREVTVVAAPAGPGSQYPHLAGGDHVPIVLSWLQAQPGGGVALQHATWRDGTWSSPATVATGTDWFVNWADFPSVVPITATTWLAHWLEQRPGSVYSYDVRLSGSTDGGRHWSQPASPHDDGTPTEHGFVSILADGGLARAVWLDGRHTGGVRHLDMAQDLLRIVDLGAGEPARTRHAVVGQDRRVRRGRGQAVAVPDALPEGVQVGDGPAPQGVVGVEAQAALLAQPVLVETDLRDVGRFHAGR